MKIENRFYNIEDVQLRAFKNDDGQKILEGYAARYNVESKLIYENGKKFIEIIEREAFKDVLTSDVYLTFNHSRDKVLARTINSTLFLTDDESGLFFRAELNNTSAANDLYEMVTRGDVVENSFAFTVKDEGQQWSRTDEGVPLRRITRISKLIDVSVVVHPAYPKTGVWARGFEEFESAQEPTDIQNPDYTDIHRGYEDSVFLTKI